MKELAWQTILKKTTSRCPVCHEAVPGEVVRRGGQVFLERTCPAHGGFSACIASDERFYWLAKGRQENACCGGSCCSADGSGSGTLGKNAAGRGDEPFEILSTCVCLIEIVNSCNLTCPTCYADSPEGQGAGLRAVPLDDLKRRIEGVIQRKGKIEILQLSGGEPTLHPDLFDLLAWAQGHEQIDYVVLNTNGVRIARDEAFAGQLALAAKRGGLQLYLQFDGPQEAGQQFLRGADLRATREAALDRCAAMGLVTTLAMTVTPQNLPYVWDAICFGLARPFVHGITFQPMFTSGRIPAQRTGDLSFPDSVAPGAGDPPARPAADRNVCGTRRLNTADIILAAVGKSDGMLKFEDLTPLPCGDPNCAVIGYLIRTEGGVRSVSEFLNFGELQGFLKNKLRYSMEDLVKCGCEVEELGHVLRQLEVGIHDTFRIMVKPFMDAWTWDQDRIDRCCTHVIRPDGKLDSFCRYYSGFPDTFRAP